MTRRFDEIELRGLGAEAGAAQQTSAAPPPPVEVEPAALRPAARIKRILAYLTDVSLFLGLALAMSPILPVREDFRATLTEEWPAVLALCGFLLIVSYYYFVGCWIIWGRTVGGAIFDVRVISDGLSRVSFQDATNRWFWTLFSTAAAGFGFLPGLLPGARTLPDRLSSTRAVDPV